MQFKEWISQTWIPVVIAAVVTGFVAPLVRNASCETSLRRPPSPPSDPVRDDGQQGRDAVADRLSLSFQPEVGVSHRRDEFKGTSAIELITPTLEDADIDLVCSAGGVYQVESRQLFAGLTCATKHAVDIDEMVWLGDCAEGCHEHDRTASRDIESVLDTRAAGLPGLRLAVGHAVTVDWARKLCRSKHPRVKIYGDNTRTEFAIPDPARESLCQFADAIDAEIESTRTPEP